MGNICQLRVLPDGQPAEKDQIPDTGQEPLDVLTELIRKAQAGGGCIEPAEVLKLAAAAAEAVESLLSDMEQADKQALQEAIFEKFLVKGNA